MGNLDENQINKSIQSIDGIKRAEASPFLYAKIIHRLKSNVPAPAYYSGVWVARLTFAALFIISINTFTIWIVKNQTKTQVNEKMELQKMVNEYFGSDDIDHLIY